MLTWPSPAPSAVSAGMDGGLTPAVPGVPLDPDDPHADSASRPATASASGTRRISGLLCQGVGTATTCSRVQRSTTSVPRIRCTSEELVRTFCATATRRSEEHTSELQSPSVISYAVFCLKKKTKT